MTVMFMLEGALPPSLTLSCSVEFRQLQQCGIGVHDFQADFFLIKISYRFYVPQYYGHLDMFCVQ